MSTILEQKCPACGGAASFDVKTQKWVCDYCDTAFDIEPEETEEEPRGKHATATTSSKKQNKRKRKEWENEVVAEFDEDEVADKDADIEGFDFASIEDAACDPDATPLPIMSCKSCGAEVLAESTAITLTCPYCSNRLVLTDKVSGKLRPDGVIPFKVDAKDLPAMLRDYYGGMKLLPKKFLSEHTIGSVTGVYLPFWVFKGTVSGPLRLIGTNYRTEYESDEYEVDVVEKYEEWHEVEASFDGLPVDCSGRVDDTLMDNLEPFDLSEVKPFDPRYLAGFAAERFDVAKTEVADRAKRRMSNTAKAQAAAAIRGYHSVSLSGGNLKADVTARYLLLPVYLFDIVVGGESFQFAINGQTGKIIGEDLTSKSVRRAFWWKKFALGAGIVAAIAIVTNFLGW